MAVDFKTLEKLIALAKKHKVPELEVADGKAKFRVRTIYGSGKATAVVPVQAEQEAAQPLPLAESPKSRASKTEENHVKVLSPFVGTFYRSPSPEADVYVQEGQMVKKGDVLCIVEAMKLMNEIESEANGRVISVLAENGQPVEYGEPLFLIDPV